MKLFAAALSAVVLSGTVFAAAASAHDARLSYADLDLSTASGTRTLSTRISGVSQDVCGAYDGLDFASCARDVRAEVMSKLSPDARDDFARSRGHEDQVRAPSTAD